MKAYISADMEGVSGVVHFAQTSINEEAKEYDRARKWMTAEVNAAIEGALAGGATAVVVNDAHGSMRNILLEELNPAAQLVTGWPKPLSMMQGIDEGFEVAFFIGYHAQAGSTYGTLNHTWSGRVHTVSLNGKPVGLTSSVAYGHSVGKILAFAYVKPEAALPGTEVEVMLLGDPRQGRVLGEAAYDPENLRPRAAT